MQNDFLPNFILCNTTQRFVRFTKGTCHDNKKPDSFVVKPYFYCGSVVRILAQIFSSMAHTFFF